MINVSSSRLTILKYVHSIMNDYLFNQNVLILSSALATLAGFFFIILVSKTTNFYRHLVIALGLSLGLIAAETVVVSVTISLSNLPVSGFYILFVLDLLLSLLAIGGRSSKRLIATGLMATACTLLLLAVTVNSFYQDYPTISSIFGNKHSTYDQRRVTISTTNGRKFNEPTSLENALFFQPSNKGTVYTVPIPGTTSGLKARDAVVYLPPAYSANNLSKSTFPVLVLLSGMPGSPSDWLHGEQLELTMNNFAARHEGITPIIIMADYSGAFGNDTECVDSSKGNAETYLTSDLPNFVKQNFRVDQSPKNWAIGGFSAGGMCAAMLTLRHQNVYQHFLDMSGDPAPTLRSPAETLRVLFKGSKVAQQEHDINWLLKHRPVDKSVTGQFVIGGDDKKAILNNTRQTYGLAVKADVTASIEVIPHMGHSFSAWDRGFSDSIARLSYYVGATNCETFCTK